VAVVLLLGSAEAAVLKNVKRGLNHGESGQTQGQQPNSQGVSYGSLERQSSLEQPLPTPGIPPSFLSFSTPGEKAKATEQRTGPILDEDRNSVIQDSAAVPPNSPQFDAPNNQQVGAPAASPPFAPTASSQTGPTETVVSTGTAPPEGTVIGAPYLIAVHRNIIRRYGIPVAKPYPVKVTKDVKVTIENPVPYKVDKPYTVRVNVPQPYGVDRPYSVPVDAPYPVRVAQPVGYPVPQPYAVQVPYPVPVPHPVPVHQPVAVPHSVPVPAPVAVAQPTPVTVAQAATFGFARAAPLNLAQPFALEQPAVAPSASLALPNSAPFHFGHPQPLATSPLALSHAR